MRVTTPLVGLIVFVGFITFVLTQDAATTLNVVSWLFTFYMLVKLPVILWQVPRLEIYRPPEVEIPSRVDRKNRPTLKGDPETAGDKVVHELVRVVSIKIANAADEAAIHNFVRAKMEIIRRRVAERYSTVFAEIDVISFEGIIGTLLGLIAFMAQATRLFDLPEIVGGEVDTVALVTTVTGNLRSINLLTVSTAFFTSVIGWMAKAYIGRWVDARMGAEVGSITEVEAWIQDSIIARLMLPSQVTTILEFAGAPELHKPLQQAVQALREVAGDMRTAVEQSRAVLEANSRTTKLITDQVAPELRRIVGILQSMGALSFLIEYVHGGVKISPSANGKAEGGAS